jgi:hypothetical protein
MQEGWFIEMNNYHGQPIEPGGGAPNATYGHYTQSIWSRTTSVGCGTASNADSEYLVCRYYPPGNIFGQTPQ